MEKVIIIIKVYLPRDTGDEFAFLAFTGSNTIDKYKSWVYNCLSEYYVNELLIRLGLRI